MSITLIGGMDRLKAEYIAAASSGGHSLRFLSRNERNLEDRMGSPDAVIVFTNKVSHEARRKAQHLGRARNIPVHLLHSCGVSSLRECLGLGELS